jgi:hypothetical protein
MGFSASPLCRNAFRFKHISSTLRVQSCTFASSYLAMTGSPFTLYTHAGEKSLLDISVNDFIHSNLPLSACVGPGPNPVKAAIALEHLGLQYDTIPLGFGEGKGTVKDTNYTSKVNPNGRVPGLVDHGNKGFTVFESGAILQYLAEKVRRSVQEYQENELMYVSFGLV